MEESIVKLSMNDCKRIYTIIEKWFRLHNFVNTLDYPWTDCRYISEYGVLYHWPEGSPERYRKATTKVLDDVKTKKYHIIEGDFISCSSFADIIIDDYIEDIFYGEIAIDVAEQVVDEISKLFFDKFKDMQHVDERYYRDFHVPIEPNHKSWIEVDYYMDGDVYDYVLQETQSSREISMENVSYDQRYSPWTIDKWLEYFKRMHIWLSRTNQFLKACQANFQENALADFLRIVRKLIDLNNFVVSLDVPNNNGIVNMKACEVSYKGQTFSLGSFYDAYYVDIQIMKLVTEEETYASVENEVDALTQIYDVKYYNTKHYEFGQDDEQLILCSSIEYAKKSISNYLSNSCASAEYENRFGPVWKSKEWISMFRENIKISEFLKQLEIYEKNVDHEEMND